MTEETHEGEGQEFAAEASGMGWTPKEQWRGNPDRWIDAKTFVERHGIVLPIVQQNNQEMKRTINQLNGTVQALQRELQASAASMKAIEESHAADVQAQLKATKAEIGRQLKEAKEAGDTEREVDLIDQLTDLKAAERTAKDAATVREAAKEVKPAAPATESLSPEYLAWRERNPWIATDPRRARRAMLVAEEIAEDHKGQLLGKPFYDKLDEELAKLTGNGAERRPTNDKTEGGRPRESAGNGRSFSDLPAEAKDACQKLSKKLVGPDRAFKDNKAWQENYAKTYFENEARG